MNCITKGLVAGWTWGITLVALAGPIDHVITYVTRSATDEYQSWKQALAWKDVPSIPVATAEIPANDFHVAWFWNSSVADSIQKCLDAAGQFGGICEATYMPSANVVLDKPLALRGGAEFMVDSTATIATEMHR